MSRCVTLPHIWKFSDNNTASSLNSTTETLSGVLARKSPPLKSKNTSTAPAQLGSYRLKGRYQETGFSTTLKNRTYARHRGKILPDALASRCSPISSEIFPKLPKKRNEELQSRPECIEGWGLHFVEGIAVVRVIVAAFLLIFLICAIWVALRLAWGNTQDAAATAAVVGGIVSALLVTFQILQSSL